MGLFSSKHTTITIPCRNDAHISVQEIDEISQKIFQQIERCSDERRRLETVYKSDNRTNIPLSSCQAEYLFNGNKDLTFQVLEKHFKHRVKSIELGTRVVPDEWDDFYPAGSTTFFYEKSVIKVAV